MTDAFNALLDLFNLEKIEENIFRAQSARTRWGRVFGGQTIAQALVAAQRTVTPERLAHSIHAYFLLGGDDTAPIVYTVDRIRDGGSFTTRRVIGMQHGEAIFSLEASFQKQEPGLEHQFEMPDVPPPESLASQTDIANMVGAKVPEAWRAIWTRAQPFEARPVVVEHYTTHDRLPPFQHTWFRLAAPAPDDPALRRVLLSYISDISLLDTSTHPHGKAVFHPDIQAASLDHAMWFHRDHPLDDWFLYTQDSPSSSGARGFSRGFIYGRDGTLIASVVQEGLIRLRSLPKK